MEHSEITRFLAHVNVSGWSHYLKPESWTYRNPSGPQPTIQSITVKVLFGAAASKWHLAGNMKVEKEMSLADMPLDSKNQLTSNWGLNFRLLTDAIVSDDFLKKSPDLAYNIPTLVQLIAVITTPPTPNVVSHRSMVQLAECRRYLDISEPKVSPGEYTFSPSWGFASNLMSPLKFDVLKVQKYY
jgi:hypothetical protein